MFRYNIDGSFLSETIKVSRPRGAQDDDGEFYRKSFSFFHSQVSAHARTLRSGKLVATPTLVDASTLRSAECLEGGGGEDGEGAGADHADHGGRGELEVTLVLVAVGLELRRGVDGGVLVDVSLAVAEAELVDVASLAGAAVDDEGRGEERRSASGRREWIGSIDSPKENLTRDLRGKTRDLDFGPSDAGYARIRECTLTSWGRSQPQWSPCNQRQPGHPGPWYPAESKRGGVPWSASRPSVLPCNKIRETPKARESGRERARRGRGNRDAIQT